MAMIESVDYNEIYNAKKTTRRSRRGGSKPASALVETKTSYEKEYINIRKFKKDKYFTYLFF